MSYGRCNQSREVRASYELKQAAAEFYKSRNVPERLEEALNSTFYVKPEDVYGHLANFFAKLSKTPVISEIKGKKVLDGTGKATLEVEVFCTVQNIDKSVCSSVISACSDLLHHTSANANGFGEEERINSIDVAIEWIKNDLSPLLKGISPNEQLKIDQLLREYFKPKMEEENTKMRVEKDTEPSPPESTQTPVASLEKKRGSGKGKKTAVTEKPIPPEEPHKPAIVGSLAVGGVSLAVATSGAVINKIPLYLHISSLKHQQVPTELVMPTPMISLLSYGKMSPGKLNLMKEVLVIPNTELSIQQSVDMVLALQKQIVKQLDSVSKAGSVIKNVSPLGCLILACDRVDQPLELISEACGHLSLELGTNLHLAINCAAHELIDYNKGKYEIVSGTFKNPDEMVDLYVDLINIHPSIVALLDPLRKEDRVQWQRLCIALGSRCYLIGEVATKSVSELLEIRDINIPWSSGLAVKHTNETTICDLLEVFRLVEGEKRVSIIGGLFEESLGDSIADLAVGLGARFVKLGGLMRGERTTKYNRLLTIEGELMQNGTLGRRAQYEFPVFCEDEQGLA
ncbi:enolase 4 [Bombina bombina]|uniref:enolase 4 n=1 Tax=Bombina bombina TaxID=8345 RepID=UPI00235B0FB7|nr:enolase 4 [Bombina bombina]